MDILRIRGDFISQDLFLLNIKSKIYYNFYNVIGQVNTYSLISLKNLSQLERASFPKFRSRHCPKPPFREHE